MKTTLLISDRGTNNTYGCPDLRQLWVPRPGGLMVVTGVREPPE